MRLRAATRGSALALWQTSRVGELLAPFDVDVEPVVVSTVGDRDTSTPIHEIGGKGVFVKEVQAAVLDGRADIAVHSAKDLPGVTHDELVIAAVPERADVRDALVGSTIDDLPSGATVGTGSIRRRTQLAAARPDLEFVEIRGNIDTRLSRVGDLDAIIMAAAALDRLGRTPDVVERIDISTMIPQVGQGALAVECRREDEPAILALAAIDDLEAHRCVAAERAMLAELGGDCSLPAGAVAVSLGDELLLSGVLADGVDGRVERVALRGRRPTTLGTTLAQRLRQQLES